MKTSLTRLLIAFLLVLSSTTLFSQYWWTNVKPLIPDQDNSANLNLAGNLSVWEYIIDSTTTAIYFNSLQSQEPICLALTNGVKYSNPYIDYGYPNNRVIFEGNPNGNQDIFGLIIDNYGNLVSDIQEIIASPADDHDFCYLRNGWGKMTWLEDESLKVAIVKNIDDYFEVSEVVCIDSIGCSNPSFYNCTYEIYWIKHMETFDVVRFSKETMLGWSNPVNVDTAQHIKNLDTDNLVYPLIFWTFTNDSSWMMKDYFDYGGGSTSFVPAVEQNTPFDFDVCNIGVGVKNREDFFDMNFFQAYVGYHEGFDEIFLNEPWDPNAYYNYSEMGTDCRNPQFFVGESSGMNSFNFYITWEAFVDGSWQIYYSKTSITWGSIDENTVSPINNIEVFPNPFRDHIEINFDLEQPQLLTLSLVDVKGNLLTGTYSKNVSQGKFSKQLLIAPAQNYTGVCFLKIQAGEKYSYQKVMRIK